MTDNYSEPGEKLKNGEICWRYFKSYFFVDLLSSLPGLVILESQSGQGWLFKFKLLRYMQITRTFEQIEQLLNSYLGAGRTHYIQNVSTIINTVFKFLLIFHFFACMWIILGKCETRSDFL